MEKSENTQINGPEISLKSDRSVLNIVRIIFTALLFLATLIMMITTIISAVSLNKTDGSGLFGYKLFIVQSDSMRNDFTVGDLIAVRDGPVDDIREGDIISFRSIDPANYDEVVTHKVGAVVTYEGQTAYETYGTTTGVADAYPALQDHVIGAYQFKIGGAGYAIQFLKSPPGYFTLIFAPFLIIILMESIRFFFLLKRYRKEQQAELTAQQEELAAEKKKAEDLYADLQALRAELAQQKGQAPSADRDHTAEEESAIHR